MAPDNGHIEPPLDLHTFRIRYARIMERRDQARVIAKEEGIKEGEADDRYNDELAKALAYYRIKEDMGVTEAEIMAKGSEKVRAAKLERHSAMVLRKHAEEELRELEANRSMLRAESTMSEGIEYVGSGTD